VSTPTKGDAAAPTHLSQSAQTISANSHSTKSNFFFNIVHPSALLSKAAVSRSGREHICDHRSFSESFTELWEQDTQEERKERMSHKEKKKKKDKDLTKDSTSRKRKMKDSQQEPEQAMIEECMFSGGTAVTEPSMFPSGTAVIDPSMFSSGAKSPSIPFSDSLHEFAATFECDKFDWDAEWDGNVLEG
jgi:hypothetical protein